MEIGRIYKVENLNRKFGSDDSYNALSLVQDDKNEETYLFTNKQLQDAKKRAIENKEDIQGLENIDHKFYQLSQAFLLGTLAGILLSLLF